MALSVWFMGSGAFGARCLEELCAVNPPELVVTNPPRRAGRGLHERITPVEALAVEKGIKVHRSSSVNQDTELQERLAEALPEAIFVIDFGQKVLDPFLNSPPFGCINIHPSLLPRYRGAAPLQRALMNGEEETGVSAFRLVEKMDAGPIIAATALPISLEDNYGTLLEKSAQKGGFLLTEVLKLIRQGSMPSQDQVSSLATFAPKIAKDETRINWSRSARQVHDLIRALNPAPGAFTLVGGRRLKIWKSCPLTENGKPGVLMGDQDGFPVIGCGEGSLLLLSVQPEGKKVQEGSSWMRGIKIGKGEGLFDQV